jgi:poly(beta-D-mannuronate) lyase
MDYSISFYELNNIMSKLKGGDNVLIKDGIYIDQNINISSIATLKNRLYIKAQNKNKVIFSGKLNLLISGSYITISGFTFENGGNTESIQIRGTGNRLTNSKISFNHSRGPILSIYETKNRVDHCIFENFDKEGSWIEIKRNNEANYALIDHNIFKNRSPGSGNGFETIRIGLSSNSLTNSRTIIMSNLFENCDGEIEIISSKSSENIIYNNIIKNSKGSITLRHGNRCIVANNKILQNSITDTSGIRIIGEDHLVYNNLIKQVNGGSAISISNGVKNTPLNGYAQVKRLQISKNILLHNKIDFLIGSSTNGRTLAPILSTITDNIIYKNNNNSIFSYEGYGSTDIYYNNNYFYGYNMGNSPFVFDVLLDPKTFNLTIIEDNYGTNDIVGPLYDVLPETNEINIDLNYHYNKIKSLILTDFYIEDNYILSENSGNSSENLLNNNSNKLFSSLFSSLCVFYLLFKNLR